MVDADEAHQRQFLRSLFASSDDGEDDADAGSDDGISEHAWTARRPEDGGDGAATSIVYHLAFLAPGHGDSVWNSSECLAEHLLFPDLRPLLLGDGRVDWPPSRCVEFGAGAALPSLALLREGARKAIVTDRFVNEQTFDALRLSVEKNAKLWGWREGEVEERVRIVPHTWGEDVERLTRTDEVGGGDGGALACEKADLLIASDCIYNPDHHTALLRSAAGAMDGEGGLFIVGYSLHGNVPPSRTLRFFALAEEEFGLEVVREFSKEYDGQKGIGSTEKGRGAVHVKVLANKKNRPNGCTQISGFFS